MDERDQKPQDEEPSADAAPEASGDASAQSSSEGAVKDGRIPPELREWVLAQLAPIDAGIYEDLNEEDFLELHEFLDLEELEREAALLPQTGQNPP
jgi:hypothetical protein